MTESTSALYDAYGCLLKDAEDPSEQGHERVHPDAVHDHSSQDTEAPSIPALHNDPPVSTSKSKANAYEEKQYRLQKRGLFVQAALCVFTAAAFVAAAYYAHLVQQQNGLIAHESATADLTLISTERAWLGASDPYQPLKGRRGPIIISITNYGHVPVAQCLFIFNYVRNRIESKQLIILEKKTWNKTIGSLTIPPGTATFRLVVAPPPLSDSDTREIDNNRQSEYIAVTGVYNPGFNLRPEPFTSCIAYEPRKRSWAGCGGGLTVVDLGKEKPQPEK